jgi:hypothetical protein
LGVGKNRLKELKGDSVLSDTANAVKIIKIKKTIKMNKDNFPILTAG